MSDYIIYYVESNLVCLILFGIILLHDRMSIDRQEKQIKYDHALIAFMCYFVSDTFLAMVIEGVIPKNQFTSSATNFSNYILMAGITYFWLNYVMAVEQAPNRNRRLSKFSVLFPFIVSTVALIIVYIVAPQLLLNEEFMPRPLYNIFLIVVPGINIIAIMFYAFRKARKEINPIERKKHLYIGMFPLLVIAGGLLQVVVLPNTPVFCFSCTILMLFFHIQSMQTAISLDPLTGLNNRGQLIRFISQMENSVPEDEHIYVIMLDVNDFKSINDTLGHEEGDRALIIIADSLRAVTKERNVTLFIGRYGGDEFIMIVRADGAETLDLLIENLRRKIVFECENNNAPYTISVGAGYDELIGENDSFDNCIQRADRKLYLDKEYCKLNGKSTVIRTKLGW